MNDDVTSLEMRLLALLHQARDEHDETARTELNTLLRENAEARRLMPRLLVDEQALVSQLREESIAGLIAPLALVKPAAKRERGVSGWFAWFSGRPLAAAAGLMFGIFCTSMVFAYVKPAPEKTVTLLRDGFESGPAPLVTGVPIEPGRWSGDYSAVVGEEQGVKPESGGKMLRFLRADYEGKTKAYSGRNADLYRLIDVRPYRREFADGSAVVHLSAGFNAFVFPQGEDYTCRMTLHAFDAETATNGSLRNASVWDENCLAAASAGPVRLYRNPTNWRRLHSDLRVPANTDFLLIHLTISARRGVHPVPGFGGHYIDDVRLTLRHSPQR